MQEIYKASDGAIFDRKKDCMVHEFNLKGGSESFKEIVQSAIKEIESRTDLKIELVEASAKIDWDGDPNTDVMEFVEWQGVNLTIYHNGTQRGENYDRGSQGGYTKEYLVDAIIKEYYTPYQKQHAGIIGDSDEGEWYPEGYAIDGININDILRANYGKRIRIEILE
jgi:hypothetical protein